MSADILFIDDDQQVLEAYGETLDIEGFTVARYRHAADALAAIDLAVPQVILTDVRMPKMDGFALLDAIALRDNNIPVVLITGHGDVPMALRALRNGAWDFLQKPADPVELVETIRRALSHRQLQLENRRLRATISGGDAWETRLIGRSQQVIAMRNMLMRLADVDTDVLLLGETGTGKEVAARALHDLGRRAGNPFVAVNCGAIPETMLETELFGHEPGAFTGAKERRIGKIEHANGGTLFLDEIESMPLGAQVRLLRVLQERVLQRLGSNKDIAVNVRVISATKEHLVDIAARGDFREDLAYRLDIVRVELPPLRERKGDVPLLFTNFLGQSARRLGVEPPDVPHALLARLEAHEWPGNIRELRNAAERHALGIAPFGYQSSKNELEVNGLEARIRAFERIVLSEALAQHGGKIGLTADSLGIARKTLWHKMRQHGLTIEP